MKSKALNQVEVTPSHIYSLMETDVFVLRLYRGRKRLEKIEFSPKTLEEYLTVLYSAIPPKKRGSKPKPSLSKLE